MGIEDRMPGLNDPNDPAFTDPSQNGAWQWNAEKGLWEPVDALLRAGFDAPQALGLGAKTIDANAPGASLGTANSDADRTRLGGYLAQLQGQATTGGGAWEQVLAQNTNATKSGAMALGQSQEGVDPMTAARNIGNAQAGADQRAVGQGHLLRAQTRQQATGQLSDILSGQQALDAQQAAGQAAATQGVLQANRSLEANASANRAKLWGAAGQAVMAASDGGVVPGKPKVFGDTSVNDTVPARLTPQEIVLPLSVTMAPNAPEAAARFVAAVKARGPTGETHFAPGGEVPSFTDIDTGTPGLHRDPSSNVISSRRVAAPDPGFAPDKVPASVETGALLLSGNYNQTRDAALANQNALGQQAGGYGPSVAPQAMQNATDSTLAGALRTAANSRGGANPNLVGMAAEQQQEAAGNAAGMAAGEQQRGGASFAEAVNRQRAQDLSFAQAQQQAAWRNTLMNAGVSLEQQNQLRNLLGGAAQGAAAFSGAFGGSNEDAPQHEFATSTHGGSTGGAESAHGDSSLGYGDEETSHYADGGIVAHLARQGTRPQARRPNPNKRPTEASPALPTPTKAERAEERREGRRYDAENPDLKDLEVNFAEGGAVFPAEAQGAPQPGPFAPPQANRGTLLDLLARISGPSLPDARMMTPAEITSADQRNASTPNMSQAPVEPTQPHGALARERPFIAKPQAPASLAAPAPTQAAPVRPAAPPVDPMADQKKALGMKAEAETTQADTTAAALGGLQQKLEANAIAQNEAHARASEQAQQQLGAIQQAREELKNVDTTVDPDRFMARRGWAGKLSAIVGLVLGAVGNDNGVNRAAQLLNQQIDRDLDAQKSEHELALRKGQSAVDSAQTVYSLSRQMTQDDIAANLAARGTMLDLAKNQIDIAAAKAGAPLAKANLASLSAQLDAEKRKADDALKQRSFDNHIKKMGAETDRMQAEAQMAAAGNKAAAGDKTQSALIASVEQENRTIQEQGTQLKELIKEYGVGGGLWGPGKAKMQQTLQNMATAAAKLRDPGSVARSSEVEAELKYLFQPGVWQQADTAEATINTYLKNAEQRRNDAYSVRGLQPPGKEASVPAAANQDDAGARAWLADPKNASSPIRAKVQAKLEGR